MGTPAKVIDSPLKKQNRKPPPKELLGMPRRIHDAMAARGIEKPAEVARRAKVGRDIVTQILNGKRLAGTQAANVIRIAKGLEIDAGWLLTGAGDMNGEARTVSVITPGTPEFEALAAAVSKKLSKGR